MLEQKLNELEQSDIYPFHMPGHKRAFLPFANPYAIDITEIEGFDNLHHATGILQEAQQKAADLYGAKKTYYLVNGSTCGLLAAISAAVPRGEKILMARNCHKAVYHAMYLRQLVPVYLYPEDTAYGIQGQVTPQMVRKQLKQTPDIRAVVITSPTYDGVVSDIKNIADTVHAYGIPLIVDEAHGAHFGFSQEFPENATRLGADAVIMSVHKTLPAFTQTALLHLCSDRIAEKKGIDFDKADTSSTFGSKVRDRARYSTLQDLDAGRHTEVDMFAGAVVRMGRELGIPTPYNEFTYHMIKALEEKNDGKFDYE